MNETIEDWYISHDENLLNDVVRIKGIKEMLQCVMGSHGKVHA